MDLLNEPTLQSATISLATPPQAVPSSIVPPPRPETPLQFDPAVADDAQSQVDTVQEPALEASETQFEQTNENKSEQKLHIDTPNLLQEINRAAAAAAHDTAASVSKDRLAHILEGFAKVLRADDAYTTISQEDHAAQVAQLKGLLLEAQETIITLLNDRVYDRAKLARLDLEVRLLPDLQAQAHKALGLADRSDEVQTELTQVRNEIERLRAAYVRTETPKGGWLRRLFRA